MLLLLSLAAHSGAQSCDLLANDCLREADHFYGQRKFPEYENLLAVYPRHPIIPMLLAA